MAELVNMVRDSCREIQLELRAQAVVKNIRDFDGEGSKRFREWLREVERAGNSVGADSDRLKAFASQTLRGVASDFLTRIVSQKPAITWAELRRLLVAQFSDTGDSYLAQAKLTKLKQLKGESIQNFCERIFALAEEAYCRIYFRRLPIVVYFVFDCTPLLIHVYIWQCASVSASVCLLIS